MIKNLPILVENIGLEKVKKALFNPYLLHENILVCSYFSSWCLLVLNDDFEIVKKYWGEKTRVLKCFSNFIKKDKLDLSILGVKKSKIDFKPFRMDLSIRNSWFDGDFR